MDLIELRDYLFSPVIQVALIIGLAEVAKKLGLKTRYIPIFDVVLGLLSGILVYGISLKYGAINGGILGVAIGLSACGLFSGVKNVFERNGNDERD